ncbi:MAG: PAS domain S-box protein [Campylobacteraceae bacterium]|nr:PAS domain S-box protein [Campylobacteraceae bacterium]
MGTTAYIKKTTKQDLTDKMNELNDILNNSWDGIGIIDEKGHIVFSNKALTPILNYTKEELLRVNFLNLVDESTRDTMKFALIKAKRLKQLTNINIICKRKDKQKVHLQCSLVLMGNQKYFVLNAKDYTEQVAKNDIINQYVLSYQLNKEGKILDISDAFSKFMHYSKKELIGTEYLSLKHRDNEEVDLNKIINAVDKNFQWEGVIKLKDKNSNVHCLDTKIKPNFNKYGDTVSYVFICFDITDKYEIANLHKEANDGLVNEEEDTANQISAQTKFSALGDVISNIANAWIEPLTEIDKHVTTIKDSNYDEKVIKEKLDSIAKMSSDLSKHITSFKSSFNKTSPKTKVNVKEVLSTLIDMLENSNAKNQVKIEKDLANIPDILSYESEFRDVTLSVFTNSLEAFKRNKTLNPMIDVSLTIQEKENRILLQIIDNAGGISKQILKNVFDPYFTTKDEKGKGMGLYMAKTVIETHLEGTIDIENDDGMTVVSIFLPLNN